MADNCHLCDKPINGELVSVYVPWLEHADRRICAKNIRADEWAKCLCYSSGAPRPSDLLAHAEVVAARLVEVICEDADTIAMLLRDFDTVIAERDTARIALGGESDG